MWAFFKIAESLVVSILTSRIGQIAVAFCVAWLWSAHNTSVKYDQIIANERAAAEQALKQEVQRQEYAAREIAAAATRRAEDDLATAKEMRDVIDDFEKKLASMPVNKDNVCLIDDHFARTVQQLSDASRHHPRAARRTHKFR